MHHQYSSSVSPFQANTGTPRGSSGVPSGPTTTAAAAWSWVEKMLHDAHRTSAPSATSVSISTAVWIVMCSEPVIRAPGSGCGVGELARGSPSAPASRARRGGSPCGRTRPATRSATLKSVLAAVVLMRAPVVRGLGGGQQLLVLVLFEAQPVGGAHVSGRRGSASSHAWTASRSSGVAARAGRRTRRRTGRRRTAAAAP